MGRTLNKLAIIFTAILFLAGCMGESAPALSKEDANITSHELRKIGNIGNYTIKQDTKTGCMYMISIGQTTSGLSPYYDETGKVKGCFASEGSVQSGASSEIEEEVEEES